MNEKEQRCRDCGTWTSNPLRACPGCVARYRELGVWCETHGATWKGKPCYGCEAEKGEKAR